MIQLSLILFAVAYVHGIWAFLAEPQLLVVRHVAIESPARMQARSVTQGRRASQGGPAHG